MATPLTCAFVISINLCSCQPLCVPFTNQRNAGHYSNLADFIENLAKFDFRWVSIYFYRQKMVWDMPDGCKTPCESIGTCYETIQLYQTSETHCSTSKFQLWVRQLVLKTCLCVQESLRSPLDLGFLLPDLGFLPPDLGSWILDYELWIVNYEFSILNYELWLMIMIYDVWVMI